MRIIFEFEEEDPQLTEATEQLEEFLNSPEGLALLATIPADKKIPLVNYKAKGQLGNLARCFFCNGKFESEVGIYDTNPMRFDWEANTPLQTVVWIIMEFGKIKPKKVVSFVHQKIKQGI